MTGGVRIGSYRPDDATDELASVSGCLRASGPSMRSNSPRIVTAQGLVPVSNFIERKAVPKTANLSRRNGIYSMNVAANLLPNDAQGNPIAADAKVEQVKTWWDEQVKAGTIPATINLAFGGADEQIGDTNAFIVTAFSMALFLIFFILLLEYNSSGRCSSRSRRSSCRSRASLA